jgi:preprotein translocase subunit SecG
MAARKRNITTSARSSDGNTAPSNKASNALAKQMDAKSADDTLSRVINILVILFIIAMLNPLLFSAIHYLQSFGSIQHKLTPKHNFPHEWQSYTYTDIRDYFNCRERSKDMNKPLPSLDDWNLLRQTYTLIVDNTKTWNDPIPPTEGYSFQQQQQQGGNEEGEEVAIPPPYYAKQSEGKGRGLFASRDIKEGELVHDGEISDIVFPADDAMKWKEFVFSLPRDLACDCTDWHWMQMKHEDDDYRMVAAFDISVLMNSGGEEFGPGKEPNVLPEDKYSGKQIALRDIAKDEEILTDYDAYWTEWSEVGL